MDKVGKVGKVGGGCGSVSAGCVLGSYNVSNDRESFLGPTRSKWMALSQARKEKELDSREQHVSQGIWRRWSGESGLSGATVKCCVARSKTIIWGAFILFGKFMDA